MSFGFNSPLTTIDTERKHPLGTQRTGSQGRRYRYGYNAGADTLAAGEIVGQHTNSTYGNITGTVATFVDGAVSSIGLGIGMALAAIPTTNWGWFQTNGPNDTAITTDGNVAEGDPLTVAGTTSPDGTVLKMVDGAEEAVIGWALDADSSTSQVAGTAVLAMDQFW